MRIKNTILVTAICAFIGAYVVWRLVSSHPVYRDGHRHATSPEPHDHTHTHGDDLSHGHDHIGLVGVTTHSHAHIHHHYHDQPNEAVSAAGLSEIGHIHDSDRTVYYWAKAELEDGEITLTIWTSEDNQLVPVYPDSDELRARIHDGNRSVCELVLSRTDGTFASPVPDDYICLPNHVIKIPNLAIGAETFEVVIALSCPKPATWLGNNDPKLQMHGG